MGTTSDTTPRIYVACLAAYNNGSLHGAWIDAAQEPWALNEAVRNMLDASPVAGAEEWAIHDHEGFGGLRLGESVDFDRVSELALFIAEHGPLGAALLDHYSGDLDEAREAMAERYHGAHASLADYVQELTEETTPIPHGLRYYIDYPAMARDAELNGDLFTIRTAWDVVHVFAGC
jgi:antirestriction protein